MLGAIKAKKPSKYFNFPPLFWRSVNQEDIGVAGPSNSLVRLCKFGMPFQYLTRNCKDRYPPPHGRRRGGPRLRAFAVDGTFWSRRLAAGIAIGIDLQVIDPPARIAQLRGEMTHGEKHRQVFPPISNKWFGHDFRHEHHGIVLPAAQSAKISRHLTAKGVGR